MAITVYLSVSIVNTVLYVVEISNTACHSSQSLTGGSSDCVDGVLEGKGASMTAVQWQSRWPQCKPPEVGNILTKNYNIICELILALNFST